VAEEKHDKNESPTSSDRMHFEFSETLLQDIMDSENLMQSCKMSILRSMTI